MKNLGKVVLVSLVCFSLIFGAISCAKPAPPAPPQPPPPSVTPPAETPEPTPPVKTPPSPETEKVSEEKIIPIEELAKIVYYSDPERKINPSDPEYKEYKYYLSRKISEGDVIRVSGQIVAINLVAYPGPGVVNAVTLKLAEWVKYTLESGLFDWFYPMGVAVFAWFFTDSPSTFSAQFKIGQSIIIKGEVAQIHYPEKLPYKQEEKYGTGEVTLHECVLISSK